MEPTQLVEKAHDPAVATDCSNRLLGWNAAAEELLALRERGAKRGESFYTQIGARDSFGNRLHKETAFLDMIHDGEPVWGFELMATDAHGDRVRLSVLPVVVAADEPRDSAIVYFLRPIFQRRKADEAIARLVETNGVGGLDPERLREKRSKAERAGLTRRQLEVLRLMAKGASVGEMAKALGVSVNTVRTHVAHILKRLDVHSRLQAVALAFRLGLV